MFRTIASSFQTSQNSSPQLFLKYTMAHDKNQILTFTAHFQFLKIMHVLASFSIVLHKLDNYKKENELLCVKVINAH